MSDYVTLDEFGCDLFRAIASATGIQQLRERREKTPPHRLHRGDLTAWQMKEQELVKALQAHMAALNGADAGEVARRYPWVAKC